MFYSPKKEIQRYVSSKNQQIQLLKKQLNQKITQQDLSLARQKLDKVKDQYNMLVLENNNQLNHVLNKIEQNKQLIRQEITLKDKQAKLLINQKDQAILIRNDLINRINLIKQTNEAKRTKSGDISQQKIILDNKIVELKTLNEKLRSQTLDLTDLSLKAKKQLCQITYRTQNKEQKVQCLNKQIQELSQELLAKRSNLENLSSQSTLQQLKMQNIQLKHSYLLHEKQTLLSKKQHLSIQKKTTQQRSQLLSHQLKSNQLIKNIVNLVNIMKQKKQIEGVHCQREIQQALNDVQVKEAENSHLQQRIITQKDHIQKVQNNCHNVKQRISNLLVKDSDLLALIMDKPFDLSTHKVLSDKTNQISGKSDYIANKTNHTIITKNSWSKMDSLSFDETKADENTIEA